MGEGGPAGDLSNPHRWQSRQQRSGDDGGTPCPDPPRRAAGEATLDAIIPGSDTRLVFPELLDEGLEPHQVKEVYLSGSNEPDAWVDISDTIDLKIEALREHKSQVGDWPELEQTIRERA